LLAVLLAASPALAGDILGNGDFEGEDFNDGLSWEAVDNAPPFEGVEEQAVWTDAEPYFGAIVRVCQQGASGVSGASLEKSASVQAGLAHTLSFWAAQQPLFNVGLAGGDPDCASLHAGGVTHDLVVQVVGQTSGVLLEESVVVAACGATCGSTHSFPFAAPVDETVTVRFLFGGQWTKLKIAGVALDEAPPSSGETGAVVANQWGYLARGPKRATVISQAGSALDWQLLSAGDAVRQASSLMSLKPRPGVSGTWM
jgi:hypothetical protein